MEFIELDGREQLSESIVILNKNIKLIYDKISKSLEKDVKIESRVDEDDKNYRIKDEKLRGQVIELSSSGNAKVMRSQFSIPARGSYNARGRGRGRNFLNAYTSKVIAKGKNIEETQSNEAKLSDMDEFPVLYPKYVEPGSSFAEKLKKGTCVSQDICVKNYLKNLQKLVNLLNTKPSNFKVNIEGKYFGYTTYPHDKFNQLIALHECSSSLIKSAYDYGLLYSVYTTDGSELSKIPELHRIVKNYLKITKADMVFVRVYSVIGEVTDKEIYQALRIIRIGITRNYILSEHEKGIPGEEVHIEELPELLTRKRSWSFKVIAEQLENFIQTPIWVNHEENGTLIITNANTYGPDAEAKIEKIYWSIMKPEKNKSKVIPNKMLSDKGSYALCKLFKGEDKHDCKWCKFSTNVVPDINLEDIKFEDNAEDTPAKKKMKPK